MSQMIQLRFSYFAVAPLAGWVNHFIFSLFSRHLLLLNFWIYHLVNYCTSVSSIFLTTYSSTLNTYCSFYVNSFWWHFPTSQEPGPWYQWQNHLHYWLITSCLHWRISVSLCWSSCSLQIIRAFLRHSFQYSDIVGWAKHAFFCYLFLRTSYSIRSYHPSWTNWNITVGSYPSVRLTSFSKSEEIYLVSGGPH